MSYFSNLISFCKSEYEKLPFCKQCKMQSGCQKGDGNDCYNCLNYIHKKTTTTDHYSCKKIIFNYILKHGNQFASEVAKALLIIKPRLEHDNPISILSIGCGPSTELYGAIDVFKDHKIVYCGFDRTDIWKPIQQFNQEQLHLEGYNIQYLSTDFFDFVENSEAKWDVLILNYFFSDFIKYSPQETDDFINKLANLINNGVFRFVIINDVPLFYLEGTGYCCIEKLSRKINTNEKFTIKYLRCHFRLPNEFQPTYGMKIDDSLYFPIDDDNIGTFNPFSSCRSILFRVH